MWLRTCDRARAEPGFVEEDGEADAGADHRGDEQQGDRGAEAIAGEEGGEQQHHHRRDEQAASTEVKMARVDDADAAVEQPHFARSAGHARSPRLARMRGSSSRARSTIRASRPAQTLRKAPSPASRNTGATASWMICARWVSSGVGGQERGLVIRRQCAQHRPSDSRSQPAISSNSPPVTPKLIAKNPGEARDHAPGSAPNSMHDQRRDRQADEQQQPEREIGARRNAEPAIRTEPCARVVVNARIDAAHQQPDGDDGDRSAGNGRPG